MIVSKCKKIVVEMFKLQNPLRLKDLLLDDIQACKNQNYLKNKRIISLKQSDSISFNNDKIIFSFSSLFGKKTINSQAKYQKQTLGIKKDLSGQTSINLNQTAETKKQSQKNKAKAQKFQLKAKKTSDRLNKSQNINQSGQGKYKDQNSQLSKRLISNNKSKQQQHLNKTSLKQLDLQIQDNLNQNSQTLNEKQPTYFDEQKQKNFEQLLKLKKKLIEKTKKHNINEWKQIVQTNVVQKMNKSQSLTDKIKQKSQVKAQQSQQINVTLSIQCKKILLQFKNHMKQQNNLNRAFSIFKQYQQKLKQNNVQKSQIRSSYQSEMYSSTMRALARLLRRSRVSSQKDKIIQFLGEDFNRIQQIQITNLKLAQLTDFIALFAQLQMQNKVFIVSQQRLNIIDKYLNQIHNKLLQFNQSNQAQKRENLQQFVEEQNKQKRYFSYLILATRCANIYRRQYPFKKFLKLISDKLTTYQINSYQANSIAAFLLRLQTLNSINQQHQLLLKLIKSIQTFIQKIDSYQISLIYSQILAIYQNSSFLLEINQVKEHLNRIQAHLQSRLNKQNSQEIFYLTRIMVKKQVSHHRLCRKIFQLVLRRISQQGQTWLNPLFVVSIFSLITKKQIKILNEIDPLWERNFVKMYQKYICQPQALIRPNLSIYFQHVQKIVLQKALSKQSISVIVKSFQPDNFKSIIPYDNQSLMLENYYLMQKNAQKICASLLRLRNMKYYFGKSQKYFQDIFHILEQKIGPKRKQYLINKYGSYIFSNIQIKDNKQTYLKTICRYCHAFGKNQLIPKIFIFDIKENLKIQQEIMSREDQTNDQASSDKKMFSKSSNNRSKNSLQQSSKNQIDLLKIKLNHKSMIRISSCFHNFILIMLDSKFQSKFISNKQQVQKWMQNHELIHIIKQNQSLRQIFLDNFISKTTGQAINFSNNHNSIQLLIQIVKYLIREAGKVQQKGQMTIQKINSQKQQKFFYKIMLNYTMDSLKTILKCEDVRLIVERVLQSKIPLQISNSNNAYNNSVIKSQLQSFVLTKKVIQCLQLNQKNI